MENKNAHKLDPKKINKIFIWIAFICVFLFTACFGIKQVKENWKWLLIAFAIVIVIVAAIWITLYVVARKQNQTENDKNIKKIIKERKENDSK